MTPSSAERSRETPRAEVGDALRALLAQELADLSPATRQALHRARQTALARGPRAPASRPGRWMPTGVAFAGLCALVVLTNRGALDPPRDPHEALVPYEWLSTGEAEATAPELVEDLEFFTWLAARESSG